jgi:hypothetical protein
VSDADAPNIIAMPCGYSLEYSLERAVREVEAVAAQQSRNDAAGGAAVYVAAGSEPVQDHVSSQASSCWPRHSILIVWSGHSRPMVCLDGGTASRHCDRDHRRN